MPAFTVQIIAFLVALIGTFFKCVKETPHGKPVHSSRGLPVLTTPGKYILSLLIASFLASLWLTYNSAKEAWQLQHKLDLSLENLRDVNDRLAKTQKELVAANANNTDYFEKVLKEQVKNGNNAVRQLQGVSDLLDYRVRQLSEVHSFGLLLFFDGMDRPPSIADRSGLSPGEGRVRVRRDSPGLFKDMLCNLHLQFQIPISWDPAMTFRGLCVGHDLIIEIVDTGGAYERVSFPLEVSMSNGWKAGAE